MPALQLTHPKLHYAACYADVQTLQVLYKVRWITGNVQELINGMHKDIWTPRRMIEARRINNLAWASGDAQVPKEKNSEKAYEAFMDLVQKIIDDHDGSTEHAGTRFCGLQRQRMVPVPQVGTWQWALHEKDPTREEMYCQSEHLETAASDSDTSAATVTPNAPTELNSTGTQPPRILKTPKNDYTAEIILSEWRRDEFEWVSLGLMGGDHLMIDGRRVVSHCACAASA